MIIMLPGSGVHYESRDVQAKREHAAFAGLCLFEYSQDGLIYAAHKPEDTSGWIWVAMVPMQIAG